MWETEYQARLADWNRLRQAAQPLDQHDQLLLINDWWFRAPIVNRVLRWDNYEEWPDPWNLLTNNGYCDLARALGIVYTLMMLSSPQYTNLEIITTEKDNLVQVDSGKYILNWAPGEMLNINSHAITVKNRINSTSLASF